MYIKLGENIDKRDLKPYTFPPANLLRELNCKSICLGNYIEWNTEKTLK